MSIVCGSQPPSPIALNPDSWFSLTPNLLVALLTFITSDPQYPWTVVRNHPDTRLYLLKLWPSTIPGLRWPPSLSTNLPTVSVPPWLIWLSITHSQWLSVTIFLLAFNFHSFLPSWHTALHSLDFWILTHGLHKFGFLPSLLSLPSCFTCTCILLSFLEAIACSDWLFLLTWLAIDS